MIQKLREDPLRDGRNLETYLLRAPLGTWMPSIRDLIMEIDAVRREKLWQWQVEVFLRGEDSSDLQTLFYVGLLEGKPIALSMLFLQGPAGILAYVATAASHRQIGACGILLRNLIADSHTRGCRLMTVNTKFQGPLYRLLEKQGFRSAGDASYSLIRQSEADVFQRMFAGGGAAVAAQVWKHFPLVDKLYCIPQGAYIRNFANRAFGAGTYEGGFVTEMRALALGSAQALVLESDAGSVVGHACLRLDEGWVMEDTPAKSWILDLFVHPDFESHVPDLLAKLELPRGKTLCFVDAGSGRVQKELKRLGFRQEGRLRCQTPRGDVIVLGIRRAD